MNDEFVELQLYVSIRYIVKLHAFFFIDIGFCSIKRKCLVLKYWHNNHNQNSKNMLIILKFFFTLAICSFITELPEVFSVLRLSSFSISLLTTGLSWLKVEAFRLNLHQYRLTTIVNNTCSQQKKYFMFLF